MSGKPWIGINGDFRDAKTDGSAGALSWFQTGYYDSVMASGGLPVLLPPLAEDDDLKPLLKKLDGLVLAGCSFDLNPATLGLDHHPTSRPMPKRREDFDRRLCEMAVKMRIPILAIGSGMQLLNVICGGTLLVDIPESVSKAMLHRDPVEPLLRHTLEIVPGTRIDDAYGAGEQRVNSQHHMAIDRVGEGFIVSAATPDGVIEAIEADDEKWFCVGVQWHPESITSSGLDNQVFDAFLDAAAGSPAVIPFKRKAA